MPWAPAGSLWKPLGKVTSFDDVCCLNSRIIEENAKYQSEVSEHGHVILLFTQVQKSPKFCSWIPGQEYMD